MTYMISTPDTQGVCHTCKPDIATQSGVVNNSQGELLVKKRHSKNNASIPKKRSKETQKLLKNVWLGN